MTVNSLSHFLNTIRTNVYILPALSSLPFGALRKAQRTLDRTNDASDSGEESDGSYSNEGQSSDGASDEGSKREDDLRVKDLKKRTAIAARKSKNA